MKGRLARREKIDFLLENKHYRQLHLALYLTSVVTLVLVYFTTVILFSKFVNVIITAVFSLVFGLALVFHRDRLVKKISDHLNEKKRQQQKQNNKRNLKTTLNRLGPSKKRKIKFDIKGQVSFAQRVQNLKQKFSKNNQEKEYVEIK